jgi:hypothetical protein
MPHFRFAIFLCRDTCTGIDPKCNPDEGQSTPECIPTIIIMEDTILTGTDIGELEKKTTIQVRNWGVPLAREAMTRLLPVPT